MKSPHQITKIRISVGLTLPTKQQFLMVRPQVELECNCEPEEYDEAFESLKKEALKKLDDVAQSMLAELEQ